MSNKRIYILGAGSSIGHSRGLFPSIRDFFVKARGIGVKVDEDYKKIVTYVDTVFGRNILKEKVDIEDLFTHIEIELERSQSAHILEIRQELLRLVQTVFVRLAGEVAPEGGEYSIFKSLLETSDTVITFNWDLLLDNILGRETVLQEISSTNMIKNCAVQYENFLRYLSGHADIAVNRMARSKPYKEWDPKRGYYLKAHGSIDWLYCANEKCRASGNVYPSLEVERKHFCAECHELLSVLIVPPVLKKEYRYYPVIRRIWNLAAKELQGVSELVIWGYSMPPTDFYSKWLLRQAREAPLKKIIIINPYVVIKKKRRYVRTAFVNKFRDVFCGRIRNDRIFLCESFKDYAENRFLPKAW